MKSKILLFATILLIVTTSGCLKTPFCETGFGELENETIELEQFSKISLQISGDVYLTQSDTQSVVILAQRNILDRIKTNVLNDELSIEFNECISFHDGIQIFISMKDIESLEIAGSGSITSENPISVKNLELTIDGSGEIDLDNILVEENLESHIFGSGDISLKGTETAKQHDIEIVASGNVNAYSLPTENVNITIDGSGNAYVNALSTLDVEIYGSGSVYYRGTPQINVEIFGSGSLFNSND